MDFEEISCIIPCLEMAGDAGVDLEVEQPGPFRAFKTHFWRHDCPQQEGVKYIVVIRDPAEVRRLLRMRVVARLVRCEWR